MQRIAEGIRRHCSDVLTPFADALDQLGRDEIRDLRENRVIPPEHAATAADTLDDPFLVAVAESGEDVNESLLLRQQDGAHPVAIGDRAVPTIATRGGHAITTPSLVMPKNGARRGLHSNPLYPADSRPHHTVTADPRAKLVAPSLLRWSHGGATLNVDEPMPTIATERGGVFSLSSPYLTPLYNSSGSQRPRTRSVERPSMTVTASKPTPAMLTTPEVRPFIEDCQGPAKAVDEPLNTQPASDRYALCVPELYPYGLDVKYRMLHPAELKQAQGFPEDYDIAGTKSDRTEQIGNAVPVNLAKALCKHVLTAEEPSLATYGAGMSGDDDPDIPDYSEVATDGGER
jgi:DNA (cytosine-5)-methyltransferase 1